MFSMKNIYFSDQKIYLITMDTKDYFNVHEDFNFKN